jgi:hypothetical protein
VLILRSGGSGVLGLLEGDGCVFLRSCGGPGGGVIGVAVGGAPLQGGHVTETIQRDWLAVAIARLELGEMGDGVVVGLLLGFGLRRGAGALGGGGMGGSVSVFCQCRDAGTERAVLGDGGPGVAVRLDAGEAGRGCEGIAGEGGLVGDGGADRQGCRDRVRGVGGDDHGTGNFVAAGVEGGGGGFEGR